MFIVFQHSLTHLLTHSTPLLIHTCTHHTHTNTILSLSLSHSLTHSVGLVIRYLPDVYINKLIPFLAEGLDHTPHLQFYVQWCRELLCAHGDSLKERSSEIMGSLRDLQKSVLQKQRDIGSLYVRIHDCVYKHTVKPYLWKAATSLS